MKQDSVATLLSGSEVARHANLASSRFAKLLASGEVKADYRQGNTYLFTQATADAVKGRYGARGRYHIAATSEEISKAMDACSTGAIIQHHSDTGADTMPKQ